MPQSTVRKNLFHVSDFLPTLSTLAEADLQITDTIDGIDLSAMILEEEQPFRNEIVTTDNIFQISSLILNNYKLLIGTFVPLKGLPDTWLGSNASRDHLNFDEYYHVVKHSTVGQLLKKYNIAVNKKTMQRLRDELTVKCLGVKTTCNLLVAPCLFDIDNDPCEEVNLADAIPDVLQSMKNEFTLRTTVLSPILNKAPGLIFYSVEIYEKN